MTEKEAAVRRQLSNFFVLIEIASLVLLGLLCFIQVVPDTGRS